MRGVATSNSQMHACMHTYNTLYYWELSANMAATNLHRAIGPRAGGGEIVM